MIINIIEMNQTDKHKLFSIHLISNISALEIALRISHKINILPDMITLIRDGCVLEDNDIITSSTDIYFINKSNFLRVIFIDLGLYRTRLIKMVVYDDINLYQLKSAILQFLKSHYMQFTNLIVENIELLLENDILDDKLLKIKSSNTI